MTWSSASDVRFGRLHLRAAIELRAPQARHRRVERDPVYPGRQRGVPAEGFYLAIDLEQDVLRDFLGIFPILQVPERKLLNPRAVEGRQIRDG